MTNEDNAVERFEKEFRRWATRPPTKPAHLAARDVVARVTADAPSRPRSSFFALTPMRGVMAAASLALAVAATTYVLRPGVPHRAGDLGGVDALIVSAPPPDADMVVLLDDGTPVHVFLPGSTPVSR